MKSAHLLTLIEALGGLLILYGLRFKEIDQAHQKVSHQEESFKIPSGVIGWYGLSENGGPIQYHRTLDPLQEPIRLGCLKRLREGDLLTLSSWSGGCVITHKRLPARALIALGLPLSLNSASAEELRLISGLGARRVEKIIEGRPWRSARDLSRIKGLGARTISQWSGMLSTTPPRVIWQKEGDEHE